MVSKELKNAILSRSTRLRSLRCLFSQGLIYKRYYKILKNCSSENPCANYFCPICSFVSSYLYDVYNMNYTITISLNRNQDIIPLDVKDIKYIIRRLKLAECTPSIVVPDIKYNGNKNYYDTHLHILCKKSDNIKVYLNSKYSKVIEEPRGFLSYLLKQNDSVLNEYRQYTNKHEDEKLECLKWKLKYKDKPFLVGSSVIPRITKNNLLKVIKEKGFWWRHGNNKKN